MNQDSDYRRPMSCNPSPRVKNNPNKLKIRIDNDNIILTERPQTTSHTPRILNQQFTNRSSNSIKTKKKDKKELF